MPAYTAAGEPIGDEVALRLRGFPGGSARAGNWVRGQFQRDAVGESLSLFAATARHDMLSADGWRAAEAAAGVIGKRWREPDAGIWELDDKRWTHLPARLRVRTARDRGRGCRRAARRARPTRGRPLERPGRRHRGETSATPCTRAAGGSGRRTTLWCSRIAKISSTCQVGWRNSTATEIQPGMALRKLASTSSRACPGPSWTSRTARLSPSSCQPAAMCSTQSPGSRSLRAWVRPRGALTDMRKPSGSCSRQARNVAGRGQR
jgi:hypothetical protein